MSVNKVILLGNLGGDPEVRYMPNGEAVANFSIATSENWKDKNGERVTKTEWHNITLYRRLAEIAGEYLTKGSQVYIEGKIQSRKYTGKDGVERTAYGIIGSELKMVGSRTNTPQADDEVAAPPEPPKKKEIGQSQSINPISDFDDDIPF